MTQLPLFSATPMWTITDLTRYLRVLLESDEALQDLWVQGEVSNLSRPASGHLYFTIKDSASALKVVMWRSSVHRQSFLPRDGQAIEVHGSLNIYEATGQYQLYADLLRPAGEGARYQEFLRLKARLEAEGLFDAARKRPLPRWPKRIGVVTSPSGAALRDILNTLRRRYPLAEVVLAPTAVQGDEAPPGIVAALQALNRAAQPDVILLARGGGSIEDLWAFNNESVVRAVVASAAPVITGVGHETDFTLVDFAGDLRAPTPTAAAEQAVPNRGDLQDALQESQARLLRAGGGLLNTRRWQTERLEARLASRSPLDRVRSDRQRIDDLARLTGLAIANRLRLQRARLEGQAARLDALNPRAVLRRGFAILTRPDGRLVPHAAEVSAGERLLVQLQDGRIPVQALQAGEPEGAADDQ